MSLDRPDHDKIKRTNPALGVIWKAGDAAYYIGILGAVFSPIVVMIMRAVRRSAELDQSLYYLRLAGKWFLLFVAIGIVGVSLKRLSRSFARSGHGEGD